MIPKFTAKIKPLDETTYMWGWYSYFTLPDYEKVRLKRWIKTFKDDQRVDITIKKHHNKRSDPFNSYYWGVVVYMLSEHLGYTKDEMHEALKIKFTATVPADKLHLNLPKVESTAKMSTERFGEYIEEIKRWAAEYLSLYIPDPNEVE